MSFAEQALSAFSGNVVDNLHTSFPAKVVDYNEAAGTCTVQPLFMLPSGVSYPQVQNVPVVKWRYKIMQNKRKTEIEPDHTHAYSWTLEGGSGVTSFAGAHDHDIEFEEIVETIQLLLYPGDIVLCVCCERSIDSISSGQVHNPQSQRRFDMSDAIVTSIIHTA